MIKDFKFSVVMSVYNTSEYLSTSIDSVINQTLDFEDNVQLIIVDDKSTDNSREIITDYFNKYPRNIKVIFLDENKGWANARNVGIEQANGKYVTFLDSDDYFEKDAFEKVLSFFDKHYLETDIISIPTYFFEREKKSDILNTEVSTNKIVNLEEEPNTILLQVSGGFFRKDVFTKFRFQTNNSEYVDAMMVNKVLLEKKKLGVVSNTTYYRRTSMKNPLTADKSTQKHEHFIEHLDSFFIKIINYSMDTEGKVPKFIQYMIAYNLQGMLKQKELIFESKSNYDKFYEKLHYVLDFIDVETITENEHITPDDLKSFYVYMKNNEKHFEVEAKNVIIKSDEIIIDDLSKHDLSIDIIKIKKDIIYISGFLNSNFDKKNISIIATKLDKKTNKKERILGKYVKCTSREDITFLSNPWKFFYNFDIEIPITDDELSNIRLDVLFHKDGDKNNFSKENIVVPELKLKFMPKSNISDYSTYFIKDNHTVLFKSNMFIISPYKYRSMIGLELHDLIKILRDHKKGFLSTFFVRLVNLIKYPFNDKKP